MLKNEERRDFLQLFFIIAVLVSLFFAIAFAISKTVELGIDFSIFYGAAKLFWNGENPYTQWGFFNPPWLPVFMLPFLTFSPEYAFGLWTAASLIAIILAAKRMGVFQQKRWWLAITVLILSPPVILCLVWGNLDLLLVYLCTINHPIALLMLALKPHIYWPVILFRLVIWWKIGKRKTAFWTAFCLTAAYLISFALYGFYLLGGSDTLNKNFNTSLWPYGILVGIVLLVSTYLTRNRHRLNAAMATGPFLSPQVTNNAWSTVLVSLCRKPILLTIIVCIYWSLPFIL
jgi:hypothetical protein